MFTFFYRWYLLKKKISTLYDSLITLATEVVKIEYRRLKMGNWKKENIGGLEN
jgi:hypothetical protein